MPCDASADTSGRLSRWTQLIEPLTARNCLFSPSLILDFLSERHPLGITIGETVFPEQTWPDGCGSRKTGLE